MQVTSDGMGLSGRLIVLRRVLSKIHNFRLHFNLWLVIATSRRVAPIPRLIVPASLSDLAVSFASFVLPAFAFALVVVRALCLLLLGIRGRLSRFGALRARRAMSLLKTYVTLVDKLRAIGTTIATHRR